MKENINDLPVWAKNKIMKLEAERNLALSLWKDTSNKNTELVKKFQNHLDKFYE